MFVLPIVFFTLRNRVEWNTQHNSSVAFRPAKKSDVRWRDFHKDSHRVVHSKRLQKWQKTAVNNDDKRHKRHVFFPPHVRFLAEEWKMLMKSRNIAPFFNKSHLNAMLQKELWNITIKLYGLLHALVPLNTMMFSFRFELIFLGTSPWLFERLKHI